VIGVVDDFIQERGYLTLGSRFKRLGERFQADVSRFVRSEGIEVPAGLLPILGALDRHGPLTVGGLADGLGIAQPGVTRALSQLVSLGLIASEQEEGDLRRRHISLTHSGESLAARMKAELWPHIEQAVTELCLGLDGSILEQLSSIESALDAETLQARAARLRSRSLV
jgi:DNA-binding MarR family transcriptional regulator